MILADVKIHGEQYSLFFTDNLMAQRSFDYHSKEFHPCLFLQSVRLPGDTEIRFTIIHKYKAEDLGLEIPTEEKLREEKERLENEDRAGKGLKRVTQPLPNSSRKCMLCGNVYENISVFLKHQHDEHGIPVSDPVSDFENDLNSTNWDL